MYIASFTFGVHCMKCVTYKMVHSYSLCLEKRWQHSEREADLVLWFLIWPTFIQNSKYEPWTFDLSASYSADLKLVIIAAWRVKEREYMVCWSHSLVASYYKAFRGTWTLCPPLETSWIRDFKWRPLFTCHRNHILQEHHPHSHTLSSTGIDKNGKSNCLETSQACIIHLYKAFSSAAHAEACQTRRHGMTIMTTVMSGERWIVLNIFPRCCQLREDAVLTKHVVFFKR